MPPRNNFLTTLFDKNGQHGQAFFDSLPLDNEVKAKMLQQYLIDNKEVPVLRALKLSYGSRAASPNNQGMHGTICPEDFGPVNERLQKLDDAFVAMNNPTFGLRQRLDLWDSHEPGFILALFGGDGATPSGIGCIACPVCTPVDSYDANAFGAPKWDEIFEQPILDKYFQGSTTTSHCVVGSVAHNTWDAALEDHDEFVAKVLPVMFTDGEAIGRKPNNGGVYQMIFIPSHGEAPVGFFMATTTTFAQYLAAFDGNQLYRNFVHLMKQHEQVFRSWFDAVNANQAGFKIPLYSATKLWASFPTTSAPDGVNVLEAKLLAPLLIQKNQFCRGLLDDAILRAPTWNTPNEFVARATYRLWRDRASKCYPTELGTQRPPSRQAFMEQLLPPESAWPEPYSTWTRVCALDPVLELPESFKAYPVTPVPVGPALPQGWKPRRLQLVQQDDPMAAFRAAIETSRTMPVGSPAKVGTQVTPPAPLAAPTASTVVTPATGLGSVTPSLSVQRMQQLQTPGGHNATPHQAMASEQRNITPSPSNTWRPGNSTDTAIDLGTPPPKRARVGFDSHEGRSLQQYLPGGRNGRTFGHHGSVEVFSPSRQNLNARLGEIGQMQPLIFNASTGTLSRLKYKPVQQCSITSSAGRRECNPKYLQMCLVMLFPLPLGQVAITENYGEVTTQDLLYVTPPTQKGTRFLTGFDHGNNGEDAAASLRTAIKVRWTVDRSFTTMGLPQQSWHKVLNGAFVQRGYNIALWSMDHNQVPPAEEEKQHTLLHFLPMLDPTYRSDRIPHDGIPWRQMFQWARLIYYFYSMPYCKSGEGLSSGYDDTNFEISVFGDALKTICQWIQNPALERLWQQRQQQCTVAYIHDVSELFALFHSFVEYRMGDGFEFCGIDEAVLEGRMGSTLVVPATMGEGFRPRARSRSTNHLITKIDEYKIRMERKWGSGSYNAQEAHWSLPAVSLMLAPKATPPGGGSQLESQLRNTEEPRTGRGKRQRDEHPIPFSNNTPPFEYVGQETVSSVAGLKRVLQSSVRKGDFPRLVNPDTKSGKEKHSICLSSAFVGHCSCGNVRTCRTRIQFNGFSKDRLHVDLSETKWSNANYKESNWKSVVDFLQKYHNLVKPTEALKQLTPSTQWP